MNNVKFFETPATFFGSIFPNSYEGFLSDMYELITGIYDDVCIVQGEKSDLSKKSVRLLKKYASQNRMSVEDVVEVAVFPLPDGTYAHIYGTDSVDYRVSIVLEDLAEDFRESIKKKTFYDSFFRYISKNLSSRAYSGTFKHCQNNAVDVSKKTMSFFGVPLVAWNSEGGNLWQESLNAALAKKYFSPKAARLRETNFGF